MLDETLLGPSGGNEKTHAVQGIICNPLPRLSHARSCQCWLCSADLPLTEQLSAAYKTQYEAEWDDLADELWLESMPAWKREDEMARRDAEAA